MKKTKKTILVVDDEPKIVLLMKNRLQNEGYEVLTASDGEQAYQMLKRMDPKPDLITLDIRMPKMGGISFYECLRHWKNLKRYPVLIVTADTAIEQKFPDLKVAGFIYKPFDGEMLVKKVEECFKLVKFREDD